MIFVNAAEARGMDVQPERQRRLGASVRSLRERNGLSQAALAGRIGVDLKTIQRIENARVPPNLRIVWALADTLNIPVAVVLGEEPMPPMTGGVDADLSGMESRLMALIQQNSRDIAEVAERQAKAAEEIRQRLDALESARPGRGRKAG